MKQFKQIRDRSETERQVKVQENEIFRKAVVEKAKNIE